MYKRLLIGISSIMIAVAVILPAAQAHAQSNSGNSESILSGLWDGINLHFGSNSSDLPKQPAATGSTTPATSFTSRITNTYAALGDSVAAGVGLSPVAAVPAAETRCGRTTAAYPYAVARGIGLPLQHVACSGATAGDLFTKQRDGSPNLPAQLDTAFANGTPKLITITAGANDAHWSQFLASCYYTNCSTQTATVAANTYLVALQAKLFAAFTAIDAYSNGKPPTTIITGYYNPVSTTCTNVTSNITSAEITWLTSEVNALNQTIQQVAAFYPNVKFVPVDFTGHDVCSNSSWIQGQNDPRPFHPTATGQGVIAQAVLRSLGR
jgi:lysophospholipase L1-like esterase